MAQAQRRWHNRAKGDSAVPERSDLAIIHARDGVSIRRAVRPEAVPQGECPEH